MNNDNNTDLIDYEELKKVIVDANEEVKQKDILDYRTRHPFRTRFLKFLNGTLYAGISVIAFSYLYEQWSLYFAGNSSFSLFHLAIISLMLAAIVLSFFIMQQETFDDNSIETETSFATNISIMALIIAIIALIK